MSERRKRSGQLPLVAAALLVASGVVFGGDEDKDPAYMIYIDPETGKYTTEDPDAAPPADAVVTVPQQSSRSSQAKRSDLPLLIAGATVLVVVLAVGVLRQQRKPIL